MQLKDLLFIPLYIHQGKQMKRTAMRLPEATGERHGSVMLNGAATKAIDRTLNLMIVGDSAAAGVGTDTQEQALGGQLVANLQASAVLQAQFSQIDWALHATSGHTSFDSLRRLYLLKPPATPVDIMIVNVGVNDTTKGVSPKRWRMQIEEIIAVAKRKFGAKHIIFPCLPPMAQMPALPKPLNGFMGAKAAGLDKSLQRVCEQYDEVTYAPIDFTQADFDAKEMFASDGLHPNTKAYAYWATELAAQIEKLI
ncbi:SGNH/GDSL hydrolase family protein [Psychrobacter arenosus]